MTIQKLLEWREDKYRREWWMEFWERRDDPDASPARELALASEDQVLQSSFDWLRG